MRKVCNIFLKHASKKYYEGNPVISDEQFDALAAVYKFHDVGYQVTDGTPHYFQMYSLQKFFSIEECLPRRTTADI